CVLHGKAVFTNSTHPQTPALGRGFGFAKKVSRGRFTYVDKHQNIGVLAIGETSGCVLHGKAAKKTDCPTKNLSGNPFSIEYLIIAGRGVAD
ncbi:MAG: hypothetical protein IKA70_06220, partial [Alistipes sp.]|nr:hypothetical protein [Alistipes sp.]